MYRDQLPLLTGTDVRTSVGKLAKPLANPDSWTPYLGNLGPHSSEAQTGKRSCPGSRGETQGQNGKCIPGIPSLHRGLLYWG